MNVADRKKLTSALSLHVGAIAADLRAQMLAPGPVRERARKLHGDEQVGDDFDVWTDLLSRRAAVLWVLKTVYVRVLEDRGLLRPGRLLDREAQQLFEKLAPNLGDTAFLRWVFRDLGSSHGGLPELFAPQPAEVAVPADARSHALLEFWRAKDADTGFQWSFATEEFAGELMGDLYQELDPVVKDRYALCQTPDFVRDFILGQTLTPAMAELGGDAVRLLDPACGSGHFLLDGLRRIVDATALQHPDWERRVVVEHALDRVVGIDLNDYACALARARMVMTTAGLAGVQSLAEAARFHPHVYWADGLEQVERDQERPAVQLDFLGHGNEAPPRAILTRPHVRALLRPILTQKFHVVVGNPPYITERDPGRKRYHREKVGSKRRFVSSHREYSLVGPFIERCLQLAKSDGRIGLIVGNNFMKREFGRPLVENVLAKVDVELVVDTSQADVRQRDATTVMLFFRNRSPQADVVRAVMGKRGETATSDDPANGKVWCSIVEGFGTPGYENEFVSVADVPRSVFAKHPWSLGGGGAAELRQTLEMRCRPLAELGVDIGFGSVTREDDVYLIGERAALRLGVAASCVLPMIAGESVRDWRIDDASVAIWPYDANGLGVVVGEQAEVVCRTLWPWRTRLKNRVAYGESQQVRGLKWFEYSMFFTDRFRSRFRIAYAHTSAGNHFALDRGGRVFKDTAPILRLAGAATEEDYLALLGLLNSAVACFWMKQVFQVKGGESTGKKKQSESWARRIAVDTTKLARIPVVNSHRASIVLLSRELDGLAQGVGTLRPEMVLAVEWVPGTLADRVRNSVEQRRSVRRRMIALQERLDWTAYVAYGLANPDVLGRDEQWPTELESEARPFAIRMARAVQAGSVRTHWFEAHRSLPNAEVPADWSDDARALWMRLLAESGDVQELGLLEHPDYKRKWELIDDDEEVKQACWGWIGDRVEGAMRRRLQPATAQQLVVTLQDDARLLEVVALYLGRNDVDVMSLVTSVLNEWSVPSHSSHVYTEGGLGKRAAWEEVWRLQHLEDAGQSVGSIPPPPEYSQGSRGKSTDFCRAEYWRLRGGLDVPKERFIAFTEVPGRSAGETLYGWAGWTPLERVKALLALDEQCEDQGIPLADRIALLDSAWRLVPDIARDDAATAARLKAELAALVGADGPSKVLLDAWKAKFPPPGGRGRAKKAAIVKDPDDEEDD